MESNTGVSCLRWLFAITSRFDSQSSWRGKFDWLCLFTPATILASNPISTPSSLARSSWTYSLFSSISSSCVRCCVSCIACMCAMFYSRLTTSSSCYFITTSLSAISSFFWVITYSSCRCFSSKPFTHLSCCLFKFSFANLRPSSYLHSFSVSLAKIALLSSACINALSSLKFTFALISSIACASTLVALALSSVSCCCLNIC